MYVLFWEGVSADDSEVTKAVNGHVIIGACIWWGGVPILLTSLPFWTEEPSEEAEGPLKPTPAAEEDEKDTNERDPGEGKNSSSKDPGKMLDPFPFLPPPHSPQSALPSPHPHTY